MSTKTEKHEELLALLQNSWDNIEFAKKQQWRATYYAFLFYAAMSGILETILWERTPRQEVLFAAASVSIAAFAWKIIFDSHHSQWRARTRIERIADIFSDEFQNAWVKPNDFADQDHYIWYARTLTAFNMAGAAFVIWLAFWG